MGAYLDSQSVVHTKSIVGARGPSSFERRWDLAFFGIVAYMVIEYTRLPSMFPVLQNFDVSKIAAGISLLGLILSPALKKKGSLIRAIDVCVVLFLLASLISCLFANYSATAWHQVIDSAKWVIVYFLISRIVISSWRSRVFVILLLLLNVKLAQFAVRLYLSYGTMEVGGHSVAMVGLGANSFFGNSNDFGVAMCVVLPIAAMLFTAKSRTTLRLFYLVSFLAIVAAMLLSGCRGALVATMVAVMVFFFGSKRKMAAVAIGFLLVVCSLLVLPQGNLERLRSAMNPDSDKTASQRLGFWRAGFDMFRSHPLLGVGPGNFAPTFRDHYSVDESDPGAWAPHSIYIQGFAETGILGALPLFILFWLSVRINRKTRKLLQESGASPKSFESSLAFGLELATVAFLVSGAFLTTLYYPHLWFLLGMSAGLHTACQHSVEERKQEREVEMPQALVYSPSQDSYAV